VIGRRLAQAIQLTLENEYIYMTRATREISASSATYQALTSEPGKSVSYLTHRVRVEMLATMDAELAADEHLRKLDVTSAQFIVLMTLGMGGMKSVSDLCSEISYDTGAMTRMLDRLESKSLLNRTRCTKDRRLVYVELTEQGTAALPHMRMCSLRVANRFLRGFAKPEVQQLQRFLIRMLENAVCPA
jgi:DNA-binding MarR family transcriptional regulator